MWGEACLALDLFGTFSIKGKSTERIAKHAMVQEACLKVLRCPEGFLLASRASCGECLWGY